MVGQKVNQGLSKSKPWFNELFSLSKIVKKGELGNKNIEISIIFTEEQPRKELRRKCLNKTKKIQSGFYFPHTYAESSPSKALTGIKILKKYPFLYIISQRFRNFAPFLE